MTQHAAALVRIPYHGMRDGSNGRRGSMTGLVPVATISSRDRGRCAGSIPAPVLCGPMTAHCPARRWQPVRQGENVAPHRCDSAGHGMSIVTSFFSLVVMREGVQ